MTRFPIQYADSPDGKIAYQVVGEGPLDLVYFPSAAWQLDLAWDEPRVERFLRRLASFSRLILINPRGTGPSDPVPLGAPPTAEEWAMDFRWVLDAVGSQRAAFMSSHDFVSLLLLFAATFPERTQALVLIDGWATLRQREDYPWGIPGQVLTRLNEAMIVAYGTGEAAARLAPELADDPNFCEWYARLERATTSPSQFAIVRRVVSGVDLRGVLGSIKAPTLVIDHVGDRYIREGHGRFLADHVTGARYIQRPGWMGFSWLHDTDWTLDEVREFLTGTRGTAELDDRVLATILFTDIVGSTQQLARLGDRRWRELLDQHDVVTRREVGRFRGQVIKTTGDGLLATFEGPARAIRCALSLRDALQPLGIQVRAGLHTGEVELREDDLAGIAVHIAERVMANGDADEVLVSGSLPPLVAGSGIEFDDQGEHQLKGVPTHVHVFRVIC